MSAREADRKRQQRAAMIVGGAALGGIAIIVLAIILSSGGGDDTNAIDTRRTTTSSSSTTSSSTTSSSSTTTTLITLPPTVATTPTTLNLPTAPPTAPPTSPPTNPPTQPTTTPTTKPPVTTTTTLSPQKQLTLTIATALNGGSPPGPGQSRVLPVHIADPNDPDDQTRVRWKLIDTLTAPEQETQSRTDAFNVLKSIKDANLPGTNDVVIRGTLPNPPDGPKVVVKVFMTRADLDAIDFTTRDPQTILDYPDCQSDDPQPSPCVDLAPPVTPTSTTTTTSGEPETTTTTDDGFGG